MYKKNRNKQLAFEHFDQPLGLKLNPENRWVKKAETIPWDVIEERYAQLFPSNRGVPAKPLRMAFGSLLLQKHLGCSDRELVEQITENPYFQYFIGLPGYQMEAPYVPSLLVEFRKRLTEDILGDINDIETIRKVYEQQEYMYCNNTHVVSGRIVSISQPYIRPIVRGKAKDPT